MLQYPKIKKRRILAVFFILSFILTLCFDVSFVTNKTAFGTVQAQARNANQLVDKGVEYYSQGEFRAAVIEWETALEIYQQSKQFEKVVIVRGNLAIAHQKLGNLDRSVKEWLSVVSLHRQLENPRETGRALTQLAQAYSSLGQPKKAIELLCGVAVEKQPCLRETALGIASTQQDEFGKVAALGSLGEAYRQLAKDDLAIKYLELAKISGNQNYAILNSLGNVYISQALLWDLRAESAQISRPDKYNQFVDRAKSAYQQAYQNFQDSLQIATNQNDKSAQLAAIVNLIQVYSKSSKFNLFDENQRSQAVKLALIILDKLPDSTQKVYAAIDLANLPLAECAAPQQNRKLPLIEVEQLLNQAVEVAENIQDTRSKSYALGAKGHFYECQEKYDRALDLTRQALIAADGNLQAKDSLYLWEWQTGRLLLKKGDESKAIDAFERAFQTLEQIRSDILSADRNFQLNFRDVIQPIYRKLAELKLAQANQQNISLQKANKQSDRANNELTEAREIIDSLRLAELQNYFGNECILAALRQQQVDELLGDNTAVFSSIILENKAAILLNLPGKSYVKWIQEENGENITTQKLNELIQTFRKSLVNAPKDFEYDTQQAANLYQLLITPFEEYINPQIIKTFVFVQDGFLRSIPMAALYDSNQKKYLIEKYAIANTPSLRLTAPKQLNAKTSRALILGVNQIANIDGQEWKALSNVEREIKSVEKIFSKTQTLFNENFSLDNLRETLNKTVYPIIHVATHAQFGIIPEDTFLVAGSNQKLTIDELEKVLREFSGGVNSIELLSLTACQTAVGDERATLGLAGIALQVGVRSALASLWSLPDESTSILVEEFYQNLRAGKTKAEALQTAQLKLLQAKNLNDVNNQYDNPGFWAPFIMIGNWL